MNSDYMIRYYSSDYKLEEFRTILQAHGIIGETRYVHVDFSEEGRPGEVPQWFVEDAHRAFQRRADVLAGRELSC